jgi:hypothetical protein
VVLPHLSDPRALSHLGEVTARGGAVSIGQRGGGLRGLGLLGAGGQLLGGGRSSVSRDQVAAAVFFGGLDLFCRAQATVAAAQGRWGCGGELLSTKHIQRGVNNIY